MPPTRLPLIELPYTDVLKSVEKLPCRGWIEQTQHYCYLKVDDRFVYHAFSQLSAHHEFIQKPDYFEAPDAVGAHISVIYPEEHVPLIVENIGQIHDFQINKLVKASFANSTYFVLTVTSPSLNRLRQMHHLSVHPTFKGYEISLHITVGILVSSVRPSIV